LLILSGVFSVEYRNESTTLSDRFMHLTNYSVNKSNSSYTHNTEAGQCQGHRWTLCTLWGYLKVNGATLNVSYL
jgi:tubulin polyglutamylase TTLL4